MSEPQATPQPAEIPADPRVPGPGSARFCAHCGASLRAGANFCPKCGMSVPGGGARPAGGVLRAAPSSQRSGWFSRLPAMQKVVLVVLAFVVVGSAVQAVLPGPSKCYYNCTFVKGPVQPAGATYSSPYFAFEYPSTMRRGGPTNGSLVTLNDTTAGEVLIWGGNGEPPLADLVERYAEDLPGTVLNLQDLGPVYGAEIGFVPGEGSFYAGDQLTGNGLEPVGAGVIAAEHDGRWAVVVAFTSCFDASGNLQRCDESLLTSQVLNLGDAQGYDDILERWQWS
ncbi:MAG TPA: zinc ribbon domain-containing protein [Acidimicrobiales bacterium]|nr:zinc ribbon domain-containing protein [Acidimicrobiales bacterium]